MTRVFISWSGRTSWRVANLLLGWLPDVIQEVRPWMSSEDIAKGKRWNDQLTAQLRTTGQGVFCVTPQNMTNAWVNFEAGALSNAVSDSRIRPLLVGLTPLELTGPLSSFQATVATDAADMLLFVKSINEICSSPLPEDQLLRTFERVWTEFLTPLQEVIASGDDQQSAERGLDDMVAEILDRMRSLERGFVGTWPLQSSRESWTRRADLEKRVTTSLADVVEDVVVEPNGRISVVVTGGREAVSAAARRLADDFRDSAVQQIVVRNSHSREDPSNFSIEVVDPQRSTERSGEDGD